MPVFQIKRFTKKTSVEIHVLRDRPLENLWGGGRAKYKKNLHAMEN